MSEVYRFECPQTGNVFTGPSGEITFGYQVSRDSFSIWFDSSATFTQHYKIVGTGNGNIPQGFFLHSSVVMPDGIHVFHLLRKIQ